MVGRARRDECGGRATLKNAGKILKKRASA